MHKNNLTSQTQKKQSNAGHVWLAAYAFLKNSALKFTAISQAAMLLICLGSLPLSGHLYLHENVQQMFKCDCEKTAICSTNGKCFKEDEMNRMVRREESHVAIMDEWQNVRSQCGAQGHVRIKIP